MLQNKDKLRLLMIACVLGMSASTYAGSETTETTAYVDSAYEWGSWELGLQPAAGGPVPSPQRAVRAIDANVKFRPNDSSAFSPESQAITQTTIRPTPLPEPPPVPVTPGTGTGSAPIAGNPADRFN